MADTSTKYVKKINQNSWSHDGQTPSDLDNYLEYGSNAIKTSVFPNDLLADQRKSAHYMMIKINKNVAVSTIGDNISNSVENPSLYNIANTISSVVKTGTDAVSSNFFSRQAGQLSAGYQQLEGAILIYTPETIVYSDNYEYEDVQLTAMGTSFLSAVSERAMGSVKEDTGVLGAVIDGGVRVGMQSAFYASRLAINPKAEVLFKNVAQRMYQFEFKFAPESSEESKTVYEIVKTLRFHAAPDRSGWGGVLWKAPSTFSLSFWHNGQENLSIPRIGECVCEQVDVDYAPSGSWATFRNGFPVNTRLTIKFRERIPVAKQDIINGY